MARSLRACRRINMAKQYIVKVTVQGYAKKGDKPVTLKASPEPQDVPAGLIKELLARELIEEAGKTAPRGDAGDQASGGSGGQDADGSGESGSGS